MPGFADAHPLQPQETVQGAYAVIHELAVWLIELTGMYGVAMSPKAGAHGELCGILCIKAALEARGEDRRVLLVPESAHGTNPATRSEEHTSELQSLMLISYAVFCLKKKNKSTSTQQLITHHK